MRHCYDIESRDECERSPLTHDGFLPLEMAIHAVYKRDPKVSAVAAERDRLKAALLDVTIGMDRAGGDRDGMPECPWCQSQGDYDHSGDCALVAARAALTPQGQSTEGETNV